MTILGAELYVRHMAFFRELNANNIVTRIDDNVRARECALAHLRGMGGSYESMENVDVNNLVSKANLPPFKYIKHNWKKSLIEWKSKHDANLRTTAADQKDDISSKFVLKSTDPSYERLNARNAMHKADKGRLDENSYLYDTKTNCPNLEKNNDFAIYKSMDARYSEVAKIFDEEITKMNGGNSPLVIDNLPYVFYSQIKWADKDGIEK